METRHVRFDHAPAVEMKRQTLNCEMNVLKALKHMKAYHVLRRKELQLKNQLKVDIASLKSRLNLALSSLPEHKEKIDRRKQQPVIRESKNIHRELDEIKRKLAMLG